MLAQSTCVNRGHMVCIVLAFGKGRGNILWPHAANEMRDFKTIKSENYRISTTGYSQLTKGLFTPERQALSTRLWKMLKTTKIYAVS